MIAFDAITFIDSDTLNAVKELNPYVLFVYYILTGIPADTA